jgi:polyhydroxyalkanoate synthesis regulator phasin
MSLEYTVENLIDVLNDIVNTGFLRNDAMEEYVQDCIRSAQKDLNYKRIIESNS